MRSPAAAAASRSKSSGGRGISMRLKKCVACGTYTMKDACPKCGASAKSPMPPSFSPEDRYGKYRRMAKFGPAKPDAA